MKPTTTHPTSAARRHKPHLRRRRLRGARASFSEGSLVESLLAAEPTVHDAAATYACATAAGWIYSERPGVVVSDEMARIGLKDNWCLEISRHNDGMLVASTAVIVQSACGRVAILAYRGTEPRNIINFGTDFDAYPVEVPEGEGAGDAEPALVQGGFYRNLRATWHLVGHALSRAHAGLPANPKYDDRLNPLEALFVTGHSLGAAMATLAAVDLVTNPVQGKEYRSKFRGVYNFGQPMVGNPAFAAACERDRLLREGIFRHIYGHDIAARVPALSYGIYKHFGREFHATAGSGWRETKRFIGQCPDVTMSVFVIPQLDNICRQLPALRDVIQLKYSWYDHSPRFYVHESLPPGSTVDFPDVGSELLRGRGAQETTRERPLRLAGGLAALAREERAPRLRTH